MLQGNIKNRSCERFFFVRAHPAAVPIQFICFSPVCFTRRFAAHDYLKHNLL
jgi:hypothetical protein